MTRDPSDGTVKEITPYANEINDVHKEKLREEITSGLPLESKKPTDIERLERSRDWLRDYFHRKPEQGA